MKSKLNLGCGNALIKNAINHDIIRHRPEIDCVHDLNDTPWPFEDNQFYEVVFYSVIEHLIITPIESLNECHRILRRDGILLLKYPLKTSDTINDDPTHRWFLSIRSLDYVDPTTQYGQEYGFYTPYKWRINAKFVTKNRTLKARLTPIK